MIDAAWRHHLMKVVWAVPEMHWALCSLLGSSAFEMHVTKALHNSNYASNASADY